MNTSHQDSKSAPLGKKPRKKRIRLSPVIVDLVANYETEIKATPHFPNTESYLRTFYAYADEIRTEVTSIAEGKKKGGRNRYRGRPTEYSQQKADRICRQVAEGHSIRGITSKDPHVPSRATIHRWLKEYPDFRDQYAQATQQRAEALFDMALEIACGEKDVQRARLIVDTLKWQAGKLAPKRYGKQVVFEGEVKQFNAFSLILQQMVSKPALLAEFASDKGNLALLADALKVPQQVNSPDVPRPLNEADGSSLQRTGAGRG
jgi:hypothetical protein